MTLNPLLNLDVVELRDRLASGAVRAVEYAEACLDRIAALEPEIQAWAYLDGDYVLAQARALDARRQSGMPIGPLHGLPVGLKDVIDTARMPTENGTPLDKGRVPTEDAVLVEKLRAAGAIIMGKTVSTEMAFMCPSKTHIPHTGGIIGRIGGGGCRGDGAVGRGDANRWVGHPAGIVLWCGRVKADLWRDFPYRGLGPVTVA